MLFCRAVTFLAVCGQIIDNFTFLLQILLVYIAKIVESRFSLNVLDWYFGLRTAFSARAAFLKNH